VLKVGSRGGGLACGAMLPWELARGARPVAQGLHALRPLPVACSCCLLYSVCEVCTVRHVGAVLSVGAAPGGFICVCWW
jgi:hypothetical protein